MHWFALALVAVLTATLFAWRPLRRFARQVQVERARELFVLQRERLEGRFLEAAAATGLPRGLRWKHVDWDQPILLVRDRHTAQILCFVGATIAFEAIEGSDMEGLPAVGNLRNATAVFLYDRGHWLTNGKALFNMNPDEALGHLQAQYESA